NVVILGPIRKKTQVEISATDGTALGIKAPVRESGDIAGTPGILLLSAKNSVQLSEGLIVAKRHIHMTPQDAEKQQVTQSEIVQVKINGDRPLIFDD
ncbi:propanediol utilization protein, partial [Listeria monocytogenes]|nr:propanediol utilization protein [Listeria monocytogenes]